MTNIPVFLKGSKSFCEMTKPLLEELDNEIERAKKTISDIHHAKELQLKNFLELFDLKNVEGGRSFEDALKTLRKLPRFG